VVNKAALWTVLALEAACCSSPPTPAFSRPGGPVEHGGGLLGAAQVPLSVDAAGHENGILVMGVARSAS